RRSRIPFALRQPSFRDRLSGWPLRLARVMAPVGVAPDPVDELGYTEQVVVVSRQGCFTVLLQGPRHLSCPVPRVILCAIQSRSAAALPKGVTPGLSHCERPEHAGPKFRPAPGQL